jgi:1-deoxy-D-xylulose-5-phosphate reductoisomerase
MSPPAKLVLLGATGSIGESTLKVLRKHRDSIHLLGIACDSNYRKLLKIACEFDVQHLVIFDEKACEQASCSPDLPEGTKLHSGMDGLLHLATLPEATHSLFAMVGVTGLRPALAAIRQGQKLILANKEILVMAGELITREAQKNEATLIPADSEHNAIHQCLQGSSRCEIARILLTASGGQFRNATKEEMTRVTPEDALRHPNWDMGPKVTIDSSTMANKGLEIIEAHWLFGVNSEQINVVIHPQSIVHSMVEYVDGSILAQLSPPDMTFAIQNALFHPVRKERVLETLDFSQTLQLDFHPPDEERFPCLRLAREALETGGSAPATFNAANEIAVQAFIDRKISFLQIPQTIENTLSNMPNRGVGSLEEILDVDDFARNLANSFIEIIE